MFGAALIFVHGLASFPAGYFSCDQGCAPIEPSVSQQSHNLAGLVMFISLTLAGALWAFLGKSQLLSSRFAMFSAICVILAIVTVMLMATALADGHLFGLYQRLNYGVSVVWIATLAAVALQDARDKPRGAAVRAQGFRGQ